MYTDHSVLSKAFGRLMHRNVFELPFVTTNKHISKLTHHRVT